VLQVDSFLMWHAHQGLHVHSLHFQWKGHHGRRLQMTGGSDAVVFGRCDPTTWHPDLEWLEGTLSGRSPPRMVVLINPCNPTGQCWRCLDQTLSCDSIAQLCHTETVCGVIDV
jgi:aspartate/methionine/tyrosine aminotransferase